jgi:hypothetical protein
MRPQRIIAATMLGAAVVLGSAVPVLARDGDVVARGSCTGSSVWKLKAGPRDGRIEVEFEVDSNRVGQTWSVALRNDGTLFFTGTRVTLAPSGSFTVRKTTADGAGPDVISARARNAASGETCSASVTVR